MKIVFTCAGNQTRWGNYMNCPKHLVAINGIPLLQRNINLFNKYFNHTTYYVSIRDTTLINTYNVHKKIPISFGIFLFVRITIKVSHTCGK